MLLLAFDILSHSRSAVLAVGCHLWGQHAALRGCIQPSNTGKICARADAKPICLKSCPHTFSPDHWHRSGHAIHDINRQKEYKDEVAANSGRRRVRKPGGGVGCSDAGSYELHLQDIPSKWRRESRQCLFPPWTAAAATIHGLFRGVCGVRHAHIAWRAAAAMLLQMMIHNKLPNSLTAEQVSQQSASNLVPGLLYDMAAGRLCRQCQPAMRQP